MKTFVTRQLNDFLNGGINCVLHKFVKLHMILIVLPLVIAVRLIKPVLLIRFGIYDNTRIGNSIYPELYLCEKDVGLSLPVKNCIDFFGIQKKSCNEQLIRMWRRILYLWPLWIINPILIVNRTIPFGNDHVIPNCITFSGTGRDINNLIDDVGIHIYFTDDEQKKGEKYLRAMGIPKGESYVCLIVRDDKYLTSKIYTKDWSYHNYRDSDSDNYVLAVEELAKRGFYVVRMGQKVNKVLKSSNTKVIDYANNGMRSDFMDIYLCANCAFTLSSGTGLDAIPILYRRPIVYVNNPPIGRLPTTKSNTICISKHYFSKKESKELTLREIFNQGAGFLMHSSEYGARGIELIENTPEEIRDVCVEMVERLNGKWKAQKDDEELQKKFWNIFSTNSKDEAGIPLHGEIRSKFGADFLRNNREWLLES